MRLQKYLCLATAAFITTDLASAQSSQSGKSDWLCQYNSTCASQSPSDCPPATNLQCPDNSCNAQQVNYDGQLLLLDVNGFGWVAHTGRGAVTTAAECCYTCANTPNCNAWGFCSKVGGCGDSCSLEKFGSLTNTTLENSNPGNYNGPRWRQGSAPYAYDPLRFLPGKNGCTPDGKFKYLTCSLKRVPEVAHPVIYDGPHENEWTSGVIVNLNAALDALYANSAFYRGCLDNYRPQGC